MIDRDTLRELLRRKPFESIEVRTTGGSSRWVRHPEFVIAQESRVIISDQGTDRFEIIPYHQISTVASYEAAS